MSGRVIVIDLHTARDGRLTYHLECVAPAYVAGLVGSFVVELADTEDPDTPAADDRCAWCGAPVRGAPPAVRR